MKRPLLTLLSAILLCTTAFAQNAYYDALALKTLLYETGITSPEEEQAYHAIIAQYNLLEKATKKTDQAKLAANPFLNTAIPVALVPSAVGGAPGLVGQYNTLVSSAGALDVTNIADGLAKFIVERTKQELNLAFFNRFKEALDNPKYKDLRTLFPQTFNAMSIVGEEIYNYQAYLSVLRESFESDLRTLGDHIPFIIQNNKAFFKDYPQLEATLQSACYIATQLRDGQHPGDILANYPLQYVDKLHPNWTASLKTLQLISASLKDTCKSPDSSYWITNVKLKRLVDNDTVLAIYLGLIYEQAKAQNIIFTAIKKDGTKVDIKVTDILDVIATHYPPFKNYIIGFAAKTDNLAKMMREYKKHENDSLKTEQYAAYFNASLSLLEYASEAGKLAPESWKNTDKAFIFYLHDTLAYYFDIAGAASGAVLDVNRKNYASAVMKLAYIYKQVYDSKYSKDANVSLSAFREARKELGRTDTRQLRKGILKLSDIKDPKKLTPATTVVHYYDGGKRKETMATVFKYGSFMAAVVEAQNSDDVQKAIENFALPPGSSRIKRETPFNVSLNAYCGLFYGYEKIVGFDPAFGKHDPNSFGLTAPIGVAISTGRNKILPFCRRGHWSHSAFISLVDVGAVAAFRFQDNTTEQVPSIQLQDIFAPGAYFSLGLPKCPLSVNIGAQMGSNLRNVTATANTYDDAAYWRYSVSLCVDIPVLNFYTKSAN